MQKNDAVPTVHEQRNKTRTQEVIVIIDLW